MSGRNIVVVGGTKGIGLAISRQLSEQRNEVFVYARTNQELGTSQNVQFFPIDITKEKIDPSTLPTTIHGLVYCPGSIQLKPFKSISDEQFLEEFNINCMGAIHTIKSCLSGLKKAENSSGIVLFSTVAVGQGMPFHASIAVAKGAVEGLTRSLAAEFAPDIRVNCIAPSLTNTTLAEKLLSSPERAAAAALRHPLKKVGSPEDVAALACFLLSDHASWITGQVYGIDGGMSSIKN